MFYTIDPKASPRVIDIEPEQPYESEFFVYRRGSPAKLIGKVSCGKFEGKRIYDCHLVVENMRFKYLGFRETKKDAIDLIMEQALRSDIVAICNMFVEDGKSIDEIVRKIREEVA